MKRMKASMRAHQVRVLGLCFGLLIVLAACDVSELPVDFATQDACAVWSAGEVYTAGDTVTYEGVTYKANWWTRGNNPASSNGGPGSGQPWTVTDSCGGEVDPTDPTPDPEPPPPNDGDFLVSEAQYNQMFPSRIPYYSYAGFVGALEAWPAFANTGSDTVKRQEAAAFLANMHHESGGGRYVREINQANWPLYCSKGIGNCNGKEYYGRGPTQLSWDYNYRAAGDALGIDLLNNPDLVADDATVGWKTALWYWMTQSAQAAQTPHAAMVNGAGFGETIRAINGGLECNGAGEAQRNTRITLYRNFTGILGVPTGDNLSC